MGLLTPSSPRWLRRHLRRRSSWSWHPCKKLIDHEIQPRINLIHLLRKPLFHILNIIENAMLLTIWSISPRQVVRRTILQWYVRIRIFFFDIGLKLVRRIPRELIYARLDPARIQVDILLDEIVCKCRQPRRTQKRGVFVIFNTVRIIATIGRDDTSTLMTKDELAIGFAMEPL